VEVRVSLPGGDQPAALESLDDWLRHEPALAGRVRLDRPVPRGGELGSLAQAVLVAIGSGGTVSVLAASLSGWLSQLRQSGVTLKVEGPDGTKVELGGRIQADQAEALLRQAFALARQ
jgi:membrane-associated two-gene conflict system component 1 (EACC1)